MIRRLAEEHCWAMTEAAGRSCYGRSGSSVLEFGFQPVCLSLDFCWNPLFMHIVDHTHTKLRLGAKLDLSAPAEA